MWRNDDVSYGINIEQYKQIQSIFTSFGIKETYSVIPCGKNIFVPMAHKLTKEQENELTGFIPVNEDKEVDTFIRESLANGHSISLHGSRHINFAHLLYDEQYNAIAQGKEFLEKEYNTKIEYFIPPYNSYNKYTVLICDRLHLKILDSSGNQLEKLVENNQEPNKDFKYYWYHAWRFYEGKLTPEKLKLWLSQKLA